MASALMAGNIPSGDYKMPFDEIEVAMSKGELIFILFAKTLEDAQRNSKDRNGASSAHLLHTSSKTEKKRTGKYSK